MYQHILIATDGSDLAQRAVDQGLNLAKQLSAKASALMVTEPFYAAVPGEAAVVYSILDYQKDTDTVAKHALAKVAEAAKSIGVDCAIKHIRDRYPSEGIVEFAEANGCDLIVMSTHGHRGLTRLLIGSQARDVITYSKVSVLVCR
jgi:nucleotide-binding universal stress UspA family protein